MRVLFIGGTGIISSGCLQPCLDAGIDLTLFNRGQSWRPVPDGIAQIFCDIRQVEKAKVALGNQKWDAVVDWVAYRPEHIRNDIALFKDKTQQFVFISSASAYQKPPRHFPLTESTPLCNPIWEYSRHKIACEELLNEAHRQSDFPITIMRPSHTYDQSLLPFDHGWTVVERMRQGKPVVVPGDGTSLWTLTHHADFAKAFVPLLGDRRAIGHAFTATSDETLTWNDIYDTVAHAAGTKANKVHVPSEVIARFDQRWGDSLLGDKANSFVFDNSKIKKFVPEFQCKVSFQEGAKLIMAFLDSHPERRSFDPQHDALQDQLISAMSSIKP